ncbi:MAG TPA: histidine--tRNA ligase [bacterium]|nr:histidine--tRNA ligase [bacterium]
MSIHALRGMNDLLPPEIALWQEVERKARKLFARYRYEEIRTPVLEDMSLFTRSIGDTTNIVEKEMYVFQDRNAKWVSLRPEGTASIVRAYVEHKLHADDPIARFYYMGPMYRYERPQKGRFRQFYQLGVEVFGIPSPRLDAEVINMLDLYLKELGLKDCELEINSLGCPMCRPNYMRAFFDHLRKNEDRLCGDCKRRMERNPLRVLDCKEEGCRKVADEGPSIQDHLCEVCEKDFDTVLETLGLLGSTYKVNPKIVRGLDYYLKTTFEFTSTALGAQNAVAGGGRYDGLVRLLGGPNVAGFGFAVGIERLVDILREQRKTATDPERHGVFLAVMGDKSYGEAMKLASQLRLADVPVDLDYEGKSLKSQMRRADKLGCRYVVFLGPDELAKRKAGLRDMVSGEQDSVPLGDLMHRIKKT